MNFKNEKRPLFNLLFIDKGNKTNVEELLNLTFTNSTSMTLPKTFNVNMKVIEGQYTFSKHIEHFSPL